MYGTTGNYALRLQIIMSSVLCTPQWIILPACSWILPWIYHMEIDPDCAQKTMSTSRSDLPHSSTGRRPPASMLFYALTAAITTPRNATVVILGRLFKLSVSSFPFLPKLLYRTVVKSKRIADARPGSITPSEATLWSPHPIPCTRDALIDLGVTVPPTSDVQHRWSPIRRNQWKNRLPD